MGRQDVWPRPWTCTMFGSQLIIIPWTWPPPLLIRVLGETMMLRRAMRIHCVCRERGNRCRSVLESRIG